MRYCHTVTGAFPRNLASLKQLLNATCLVPDLAFETLSFSVHVRFLYHVL